MTPTEPRPAMSREQIARLRTLAEQATPGPWAHAYWPTPQPHYHVRVNDQPEWSSRMGAFITGYISREGDARFIAALDPQTVLAICALAEQALAAEASTPPVHVPVTVSYKPGTPIEDGFWQCVCGAFWRETGKPHICSWCEWKRIANAPQEPR